MKTAIAVFAILAALILSTDALATEAPKPSETAKKPEVVADGSKELVLPDFSKVHEKPKDDSKGNVTAELVCRKPDGSVLKKGDIDYEGCMMEANMRRDKVRVGTDPMATGFGEPNVSVQFGGKKK